MMIDPLYSDQQVLLQLLQRDAAALGTLYDRYGRLVYTVALRITGDQERAEAVTLDVFQDIWQAVASFPPDGSLVGWVMGITRCRALDAAPVQQVAPHRGKTFQSGSSGELPPIANDGSVDSRTLRTTVREALAHLSDVQRQVIEFAYYDGLTPAAIATQMQLPLETVTLHMRLGMRKLCAMESPER